MGMPDLAERWTRAEVLTLPDDGNRYELLDGELLVTPSPSLRHQHAVGALLRRLTPYVEETQAGYVSHSPADLSLEGGQVAQPDVFVVPTPRGRRPRTWEECGIPVLAIEVLSPSTAHYDRVVKRQRYMRTGVAEYWVVDLDSKLVERWRPDEPRPEILEGILRWQPVPTCPALEIDLVGFFAEIPE